MAYSEQIRSRAQLRLDQAAAQAQREAESRIEAIYAAQPRLRQIETELRKTSARVFAAAFRDNVDPQEAMNRLKKENLALQQEREWLLESNDIDPEDLKLTPICTLCGGTGWRGAQMCDCLLELCRQEQKKVLNRQFSSGRESFEKFQLSLYPAEYDPVLKTSPRAAMQKLYERACQYAQSFSASSRSLFLTGATGLGKTFLSACIAKAAAEKGYAVEYVSAGDFFSDFEEDKFRPLPGTERTAPYFETDLLILDDLGTEMTTQLAVSSLYRIVNTRLMEQKPTVISTNLPTKELEIRYSAQIASRILGTYQFFQFYGSDLRMR